MTYNGFIEVPPGIGSSPSTPSPSVPLHLSGFFSGETIQVQGDTGNINFSVQFNIHHKKNCPPHYLHCPDINAVSETHASLNSSASSYLTPPIITHEDDEDQGISKDAQCHATYLTPHEEESNANITLTRLRSGVLSPISYRPRSYYSAFVENKSFRIKRRSKEKYRGKRDALETVLRRRSFPVRPCNSYSFFLMTTWGMVKSSSFGQTSKKLGKMWCKLSKDEKKVFEKMASKDTARYKRQCMLLKGYIHDEARNEILETLEQVVRDC